MLARQQGPTKYGIAIAAAVMLTACYGTPADDDFESNDTFAEAWELTLGKPILATAVEGNPDVFKVTAEAGTVLRFDVVHEYNDPCPVFSVHDPNGQERLGQDLTNDCTFSQERIRQTGGAAIEPLIEGEELAYIITVPVSIDGEHFITITEDNPGDNVAPFSWDYGLTALIGP